jgi:polar amino acid transport system substrate-binding protein
LQLQQLMILSLVGGLCWLPLPAFSADLATIRQRGRLIVAVKDNLPPLGFRDQRGQLQGFEIDIARRLAQELLGRPDAVILKPVLNQERLTAVINQDVDLAIARITVTPNRLRLINFSPIYYLDGTALVTQDATVRMVADLNRQAIAVLNGSNTMDIIRQRLPQASLVGVVSYEAGRQAVESGQAVAFAADVSVLTGWVREYPRYRLVLPTLSVEGLAIALPKGLQYEDLNRSVQTILSRWQREGWLEERAAYWGLPTISQQQTTSSRRALSPQMTLQQDLVRDAAILRSPQFCRGCLLRLVDALEIHKSHRHVEQILLCCIGVVELSSA